MKPIIIGVSGYHLRQGVSLAGYAEIWCLDYADGAYYSRWWCAWLLKGLLHFAWEWDIRGFEMRLDAPEWIRAHEGECIPFPLFGKALDIIARHSTLLWMANEPMQQ